MVLQDLSPRRRELAALSLQMDELREEIANLEGEMERLSAACRAPGAPASYGLRISLIAEGLATKRARLGDLTRRIRVIEADITAHPSGVYPSVMLPADAVVIPSPQAVTPSAPLPHIADAPAADPPPPAPADLAGELHEPAPVQNTLTAEPQTEPSAPIFPETFLPTPEPGIPVAMPLPVGGLSRAGRGLVWVFVAAMVVVLSLLIASLLADARRAAPFPRPGFGGTAPALLGGHVAIELVLSPTH